MPGLVRAMARTAVVAGTATAVSNRVSRRQAGRWEQQAQEQDAQLADQQQQAAYQQPPPAAAGEPDYMAELEQLAKLRDQGVISDEEFEAKKKQLLGI
ncbi:MAG TPA: SHOCT domain-containing protein [Miltoncostaeaceae bacterium]|jgi:Short C-terminal domain|nr:SHOCT domain-containing protein [Miltoncostaeaceae bacterium]